MKLRIIIIALMMFAGSSFAQSSRQITSSQIESWISNPGNFTSVSEAKKITDDNGTKLWVDNRGNILNGNSRNVGFLKVRK